ncbi:MAG: hypothetical protein ABXS92_04665 [Sulfurimonas sp.]
MQIDYLYHGVKGFERFAYYCYRYDMISKEANRRYKIALFYQKYGLEATLKESKNNIQPAYTVGSFIPESFMI